MAFLDEFLIKDTSVGDFIMFYPDDGFVNLKLVDL